MDFRIKKVDNIRINFQEQQGKTDNKNDELIFNNTDSSENTVYTNESADNLFKKLLNNPDDLSLLDAASVMFPDENITEIPVETLQELSLFQNKDNIKESILLNDKDGNNFYLIKYNDGITQTFFPDNTSVVRKINRQRFGKDEYFYTNGILQKITLERTNYSAHEISTTEYRINEYGYFVGYAKEGETIQDVLKNLGIEEDSPEAQQFMELNRANIKSFNKGRVTSFIVGREMLIHPENAISGMRYLETSPKNERERYTDKVLENLNVDFILTQKEILDKNTTWWELSRENLIGDHGIENPTDEQIAQNLLILQKINGKNKKLIQGEEVTLTQPIEKDIPEQYQLENYTLENLRKTYPADKFNIYVSEDKNSVTVTDKNGNQITNIEYMTDYTNNNEKYYTGLTVTNYDDLGRMKEQIRISPYNLFTGLYKTETYEYKNTPQGIECSIYDDGILSCVRFYKNSNDLKNDAEPVLSISVDVEGKRYSLADDMQTYYDENNEIIYTFNERTGENSSPLADKLHNALKTKNEKELKEILSKLDENYFAGVYKAYHGTYGTDLLSDIENSSIPKRVKKEIIPQIKQQIYNMIPLELPENTDIYNFTYENNILTIKNLKNNTTHTIDFSTRFIDFSYEEEREIIQVIFKMPPEAIEDLSIENRYIMREDDENLNGSHIPYVDCICLDPEELTVGILLHEIGHAVDCDARLFSKYRSEETEFKELFEKNFKRYCIDVMRFGSNILPLYATNNESEMFAECYHFIMNGGLVEETEEAEKIFIEYFSENIEMARKMLEEIRALPDDERY